METTIGAVQRDTGRLLERKFSPWRKIISERFDSGLSFLWQVCFSAELRLFRYKPNSIGCCLFSRPRSYDESLKPPICCRGSGACTMRSPKQMRSIHSSHMERTGWPLPILCSLFYL